MKKQLVWIVLGLAGAYFLFKRGTSTVPLLAPQASGSPSGFGFSAPSTANGNLTGNAPAYNTGRGGAYVPSYQQPQQQQQSGGNKLQLGAGGGAGTAARKTASTGSFAPNWPSAGGIGGEKIDPASGNIYDNKGNLIGVPGVDSSGAPVYYQPGYQPTGGSGNGASVQPQAEVPYAQQIDPNSFSAPTYYPTVPTVTPDFGATGGEAAFNNAPDLIAPTSGPDSGASAPPVDFGNLGGDSAWGGSPTDFGGGGNLFDPSSFDLGGGAPPVDFSGGGGGGADVAGGGGDFGGG